jgi:hypothetical protein
MEFWQVAVVGIVTGLGTGVLAAWITPLGSVERGEEARQEAIAQETHSGWEKPCRGDASPTKHGERARA